MLPHLPLALFRPPQAVALPLVPTCKLGGTEGREPSLHVDASASTLRPLSPYGPDQRGLPSFPRFSALRFCSSSVRRGILCRGIGGQRAWQPSLRSGRLRRPARAERDNSLCPSMCHWHISIPALNAAWWPQRLVAACSSLVRFPPMAACLSFGGQGRLWRPLTVTNCPCPRRKAHRPALYPVRKKLTSQAGRTVCLHSCGVPVVKQTCH